LKRAILITIGALVLAVLIFLVVFWERIERVRFSMTLFTGAEQYENFPRIGEYFPTAVMPAAENPLQFPEGQPISLPVSYEYKGQVYEVDKFLTETDTVAMLVLKDGAVVHEEYWLSGGRDVKWISMSLSKSFVSVLLGIAIAEGHIDSLQDPITKYVPELVGSAYEGVSIKDILQMSSGARWNEDYNDPDSDINRLSRVFAIGGSLDKFTATLTPDNEPGTFNRYNSADTQSLGMLLVRATGQSITDYMAEKLWTPMGAETEATWVLDDEGMEMVFAGLNATARDYAKIGELYRLGGELNGKRIVPAEWVAASVTADEPYLQPGSNPDYPLGYGYHWWVMDGDEGEFSAIGVYNQFVYVNPAQGVVVVKLSANSDYGTTLDESNYREEETIEFFRAIVKNISPPETE
jgi:CubicO group peptidase (beta-lactamase class C family)